MFRICLKNGPKPKTDLSNTVAERKSFVLPGKLCKKIKRALHGNKSTIFGIFLHLGHVY